MHRLFSPTLFLRIYKILTPVTTAMLLILMPLGLYFSLIASPPDYQQGEMVRIMYIHVPAAWMSLGIYSFMVICSFSSLVWKTTMSYIFAVAAAPIGTAFALITLITGSIWGKPIWGAWWVWDARLTSMLVLFFTYLGYMSIVNSGNSLLRAEKPASVIAIIGFVNIPIVKFSVDIWYSLHQPASVFRLGGPTIHPSMLLPLFITFASFIIYFILLLLLRTKIVMDKISNKG